MGLVRYQAKDGGWTPLIGTDGPVVEPPVPTTGMTLIGNSLGGDNKSAAFAANQKQFNGMACARIYYAGSLPANGWTTGTLGTVMSTSTGCVPLISFHGFDDASVRAFLAAKPDDGRDAYLNYHHEPEDDNGDTFATFKTKNVRLRELVKESGRTDILLFGCLMAYTLNAGSGRNWRDWYTASTPAGDPVWDVFAFDAYDSGYKSGTYSVPSNIIDKILAVRAETGLRMAIAETGSAIGPERTTNLERRRQWIVEFAELSIANDFAFFCYWDTTSNKKWGDAGVTDPNGQFLAAYGRISAADYRLALDPPLLRIAPAPLAGQAAYFAGTDTQMQVEWARLCTNSRTANNIAYP